MKKSIDVALEEEAVGVASIGARLFAFILIITILAVGFFIAKQGGEDDKLVGLTVVLGSFAAIGFFYLLCACFGVCRLTMSQIRYKTFIKMFDKMSQAIVITDQEGFIRYMNRSYYQLSGGKKRRPEVLFSIDEKSARMVAKLGGDLRQGKEGYGEIHLPHSLKRGVRPHDSSPSIYDVHVCASEMAGEVIHIWLISDVTHRRQVQEKQFVELTQAIEHLDCAPAGFISWDMSGNIIYLNATLANWIGFDLAVNRPEILTLSRLFGAQCAGQLQEFVQKKDSAATTSLFDLDIFHERGRRLRVDFYLAVTGEGEERTARAVLVRPLACTANNDKTSITTLEEIKSPFADYFNASPIALAVLDARGMIETYNPHFGAVFNMREEAPQASLDGLIAPQDAARVMQLLDPTHNDLSIRSVDTYIDCHDKEQEKTRYIRLFIRKLNDHTPLFIVAVMETDEQRALEEHMEQGQKMQAVGQLAGGIAHDFNNVLTAIIMSCDLLLSNHRSSDPSHPDIMNIRTNALRAATLVRQLLAFSRRQTLRPEVLDVSDMLADMRLLLTRLVGMNVTMQVEHGRDLWPIKADRSELEHVLINLASNARDAMPNGGTLTIRSTNITTQKLEPHLAMQLEAGNYVLIEVRDTGTGMTSAVREKIFEPFFTTKEVGRGTGLGLSMVYGMITQTGGHIHCESTPGYGTCFSLYLPAYEPDKEDEEVTSMLLSDKAAVPLHRDLSGSATVLVVEDEDAVRLGSVKALQSRGYTVLEAPTGVEALEIARQAQGHIDLVVSDVVMPEMDGPTLLKELRPIYPHIKFIFVSGYAEDAFAKNLPEDAHFAFLPKPFTLKQLALTVKEMLEDT